MSNSKAIQPPKKLSTHPPPPPSLSSLPDDIVLSCLARVPRSHHLNISWVSRNLRALVRSPQLNLLRSTTLPKNSLHVCLEDLEDDDYSSFQWYTLKETSPKEYGLVTNSTPFPSHPNYDSSIVAVGPKIFCIGGPRGEPSTDLWILDTRSGTIIQGPSMTVPRDEDKAAVGVIDGKIYVIGGLPFFFTTDGIFREEEEILVEVFDPKSETWELGGHENVRKIARCCASVEGKVFIVEDKRTSVYNPREGEGERMVHMVSERLSEGGSKDKLKDRVYDVCVVDDVLFALFHNTGLMWFDTKHSVWKKLVGRDGKELPFILRVEAIAEYEGRLVVFYSDILARTVQCMFVSLDRARGKICGTIDWSGILATPPVSFRFRQCLTVSE
ncbi:unnamed protein product [Eruca vesicaria subsp. sativa]|uniref:F-box domain-containing protein n=1 Tax=Eruca vesicaria subsp. sativa TaxID=29727 RepID=A0ABC8LL17_ERUVS|nr:unnamed protein product [Eruca vesicaria subsp. sativa]